MPVKSAGSVTRLALYGGARFNYGDFSGKEEQILDDEQGGGSGGLGGVIIPPTRKDQPLDLSEEMAVFLAAVAAALDE